MPLFSRRSDTSPSPAPPAESPAAAGKGAPTPSRRQAEALRRQRTLRTLTPKQARRESGRQTRAERIREMAARDATPDKVLLRDFVDTRFNIGEFLIPAMVVILLLSLLTASRPQIAAVTTLLMYLFIVAVIVDVAWMWFRFKRVLTQRLPGTSTRGLMMYGFNRAIQLRRFRMPPPRRKRGESY